MTIQPVDSYDVLVKNRFAMKKRADKARENRRKKAIAICSSKKWRQSEEYCAYHGSNFNEEYTIIGPIKKSIFKRIYQFLTNQ